MNAQNPNRGRRLRVPRLECLETRELLTVLVTHSAGAASRTPVAAYFASSQANAGVAASSGPVTPPTVAPNNGEMTGAPTAHELARERFVGRFKGDYVVGPARFTGSAFAITSLGYGGANQAFHLWTNMRINVPTDPTQPITGSIYIIPWTVGTTGTQLILDLQADPASFVHGLPTHFTWSVDPSSSGLYASAAGYGPGPFLGTMDVKYFRPASGGQAGVQKGQLQFAINGYINVGGIYNVTGVLGNIPHATSPRTGLGGTPKL